MKEIIKYKILPTRNFINEVKLLRKKYPSIVSDIQLIISSLEENPIQGINLVKEYLKSNFL